MGPEPRTPLTSLTRAAGRYWLGVFPDVRRHARGWRSQAARIPDPALRRLALRALREKRGNLEGAAAFAAFAQPAGRRAALRAAVAYQTMFDYLDNVSEESHEDPIANGRRLNSALLRAVTPELPSLDYYELRGGPGDGGYLESLIETCRDALEALPSHALVAGQVRLATERVVAYQTLNHGDGDGSHDSFERWARALSGDFPGLSWWEAGAAAGSTLDLLALLAAAADPDLDERAATALSALYFPWVGALHSLLDSLADRRADLACGTRGLLDYYRSPAEAAARLRTIATATMREASALEEAPAHMLIVAAMSAFYLCDIDAPSCPYARLAVPALLEALGGLTRPTIAILRIRRAAGRLGERLAARPQLWRTRTRGRCQAAPALSANAPAEMI